MYNGCAHTSRFCQISGILCRCARHSLLKQCTQCLEGLGFWPYMACICDKALIMTLLDLSMCGCYRLCAETQGCCQLVVLLRLSCVSSFRSTGARRQDWTSTLLPSMQSQWRQVLIVSKHESVAWHGQHQLYSKHFYKPCIAQVTHPNGLYLCSVSAVCMCFFIMVNGKAGGMGIQSINSNAVHNSTIAES